jgi:chaperone required for assembly of F1-ATPase
MSGWVAKRFWKAAGAVAVEGGFGIELDGRPVKTPAKARLILPTLAMAEACAAEWDAQHGEIKPETMPVTRAANSAIDKITAQFDAVAEIVAAYGGTDLLCYRADGPEALRQRQAAGWDPLLDWAAQHFGASLRVTTGVLPVAQDPQSLAALTAAVRACSRFELAALHDLVAISGSLILGLAVTAGRLTPDAAWDLSRIDEDWQIDLWGEDEEASAAAARKREDFIQAARFFDLSRLAG